jgi:hypothetical protein
MCGGGGGINVAEKLEQGGAVPGVAIEGAAELIGEAGSFEVGFSR